MLWRRIADSRHGETYAPQAHRLASNIEIERETMLARLEKQTLSVNIRMLLCVVFLTDIRLIGAGYE